MQDTSTAHTYHRSAFGESTEFCVGHRGELCSRNDHQALQFHYSDSMRHIALLPEDQELRWFLSSSFYWLQSPQTDPLIDPVHLICATQPGVSRTSPIQMYLEGWRSWILASLSDCLVPRSKQTSTTSHSFLVFNLLCRHTTSESITFF